MIIIIIKFYILEVSVVLAYHNSIVFSNNITYRQLFTLHLHVSVSSGIIIIIDAQNK